MGIGVEVGFAPMQPTFFSGDKEYDTEGRKFGGVSVHVGRVIGTKGPVTYQYFLRPYRLPSLSIMRSKTLLLFRRKKRRT